MKGQFIENNLKNNQNSNLNLTDTDRMDISNKSESSYELSEIIIVELKEMISSFNQIISEFFQKEERSKINNSKVSKELLNIPQASSFQQNTKVPKKICNQFLSLTENHIYNINKIIQTWNKFSNILNSEDYLKIDKLEQEILKIRKSNAKLKEEMRSAMEEEKHHESKFQQIISGIGSAYTLFSSTLNSDIATFESTVKCQEAMKENLSNKNQNAMEQLIKTSVLTEFDKESVSKSFVNYSNIYQSSFEDNDSKQEPKIMNSFSDSNQNYSYLANKINESNNKSSMSIKKSNQKISVEESIEEEESHIKLDIDKKRNYGNKQNFIFQDSRKEEKKNGQRNKTDLKSRIRRPRKSNITLKKNSQIKNQNLDSENIFNNKIHDNSIDSLLQKLNDSNIDKEFGPKKEVKLEDLLEVKSIITEDIEKEKVIQKKQEINEKLNDIALEDLLNVSDYSSLPISIKSLSENQKEGFPSDKIAIELSKGEEKEVKKQTLTKIEEYHKVNQIDNNLYVNVKNNIKIDEDKGENLNCNNGRKPEINQNDKIGSHNVEKVDDVTNVKNYLEKRVRHCRNALDIIQEMNSELSNSNSLLYIPNQKVNKSVELIENSKDNNSLNEKSSARLSYHKKYKDKGKSKMKQSFSVSEINSRERNVTEDINLNHNNKFLNVKSVIIESAEESKEQEENLHDKKNSDIINDSNFNGKQNYSKYSKNSKDKSILYAPQISGDYNSIITKLKNKNPKFEKRMNLEIRNLKLNDLKKGKISSIKIINPKRGSRNREKININNIDPCKRNLPNERSIISVLSDDRLETFKISNQDNQNNLELNSLQKIDSLHHSSIGILFGISNSSFKISDFPTASHFGSMISKGISKIVKLHNQNTTTKKLSEEEKVKDFKKLIKDNVNCNTNIPKTKILNKNKTEAIKNEIFSNNSLKLKMKSINLIPFKKMKVIKKIIPREYEN